MRFMGENAIGIAVSMKDGGDILKLGENLDKAFAELQKSLPLGMELRKVSDQPAAVEAGVGEFVQVLMEALVIVLLVSFSHWAGVPAWWWRCPSRWCWP